jgi:hypothetical protein
MATLTTSVDSIKREARQFALSGNQTRPNPGAAIARDLEPAVQQSKQQQVVSSLNHSSRKKKHGRTQCGLPAL